MDTIEEVYSKLMNARAEWQNEKMKWEYQNYIQCVSNFGELFQNEDKDK